MLNMNKERFEELKKEKKTFPVIMDFIADQITPISIFLNFDSKYKFMLESATAGEGRGRYTFLGENPKKIIKSDENSVEINIIDEIEKSMQSIEENFRHEVQEKSENENRINSFNVKNGNLIDILKQHTDKDYILENSELPFTGGSVGYIGYDAIRHIEDLELKNPKEIDIPEAYMMFYKDIIAYDHSRGTISVIRNIEEEDYGKSFEEVKEELEGVYRKITRMTPPKNIDSELGKAEFEISDEFKDSFCKKVKKAIKYIESGEVVQVVLSNRFKKETERESFEIYRRLRMENPSPYLFYIDCDEFQVIGSSPESLVKVRNGRVETLPIAGTRARGKNQEEDKELERELLSDKKELSEHIMLVDLGKEDLDKVSKEGTVKVDKYKVIERYSHVMHIVSKVSGELAEDKDSYDAFKAFFPAGTVSGSPKVRAMEIIEELEDIKRELYAGAVGYFGYGGDMDVCIAIRTIVLKDKTAFIQAGAGIVIDSVPEKEFQETINKAKALMEVM